MGVMFDHIHEKGNFMLGYRYFYSDYSGLQQNGNGISEDAVFDQGFMALPTDMSMDMHMFELMYSPTDRLTLMVMPMYMEMDMTMRMRMHMTGGMDDHDHDAGMSTHKHGTDGWGDTGVSGTFKLWEANGQSLLGTLGVSIPTGSVDEGTNGRYTHYMMQLGSGTWDFTPSLTYKGQADRWFWGAQYAAVLRMEDENESGYQLGDVHQVTAWGGANLNDWANVTVRALYRNEGDIDGHYDGPHNHGSPPDFQKNYGGDTLDIGIGLNVVIPQGPLQGNRLGIEALLPVYQDLNGIQIERDFTLVAGWQWSF